MLTTTKTTTTTTMMTMPQKVGVGQEGEWAAPQSLLVVIPFLLCGNDGFAAGVAPVAS